MPSAWLWPLIIASAFLIAVLGDGLAFHALMIVSLPVLTFESFMMRMSLAVLLVSPADDSFHVERTVEVEMREFLYSVASERRCRN